MTEPKAPFADCANCPGAQRTFVPPEPAAPAVGRLRLAIVGEGPGSHEVAELRPFVGASGRMLMRELKAIGLQRHEVHWTNAVLCNVPEKQLPEARKCCAQRLRAELAVAAPQVVMPVGALGARSALLATKPTPILKWRGSISRVDYGPQDVAGSIPAAVSTGAGSQPAASGAGCPVSASPGRAANFSWVLPAIHPAFVMRSPAWKRILEVDVLRVGRVLQQGFTPPEEQSGRRLIIAKTLEALESGLHAMTEDDSGFDVETVGLGPTYTRLVCFGLSDTRTTVIVPWAASRDGVTPWWQQPARIAGLVSEYWRKRRVVTHNGPAFDHIVARRYGLAIGDWEDTLLAIHALHPELKKNLAHFVTSVGLDVGPWKQLEDRTADLPRLWIYNGRDSLYDVLGWAQVRPLVAA